MTKGATKSKWEFPSKPSRMRWRTYWRLKRQYDELQRRWMAGAMARLGIWGACCRCRRAKDRSACS